MAWRERIVINCLLYVSRATPQMRTDVSGIDHILATARSRNQALGVTGALIFTQDNFAQLLEGPPHTIDQLMSSIKQDHRHTDVRTVCEKRDVSRRFEGWHMAYEGSSVFVARHVRVLAASFATPSDAQTARLMDLMSSLSQGQS